MPSDNVQPLVQLGSFGPRATPRAGNFPIATLALGLGQAGWQSVSLLHNMIAASFNKRDQDAFQTFAIARRPAILPEGLLRGERCLMLSTIDVPDWNYVRTKFGSTTIPRWWPDTPRYWPDPPRDMAQLADLFQARCYGRLLLFQDAANVQNRIGNLIHEMTVQSSRPGSDGRRLVLLLASIAEAEGSGMLLDIAATLRAGLGESAIVVAVLNAGSSAGNKTARDLGMANAYATLRELDAILLNPTRYELGVPLGSAWYKRRDSRDSTPLPLLDFVLLTSDDASQNPVAPPAASLAEMAYTWLHAHSMPPTPGSSGPNVPLPTARLSPHADRYDSYAVFGVSKLGLPTGAANELIGAQIARDVLANLLTVRTQVATSTWVEQQMKLCERDLMVDDVLRKPGVKERVAELQRYASTIPAELEHRQRSDIDPRVLVQEVQDYLHNQSRNMPLVSEENLDDRSGVTRFDTLRKRMEELIDRSQRELETKLAELPVRLVCQHGYNLPWVIEAFREFVVRLNAHRNQYSEQMNEATRRWQQARTNLDALSRDAERALLTLRRSLFRSTSLNEFAPLFRGIEEATECLIEYVRCTVIASAWKVLTEYVDRMQESIRAVAGHIPRAVQEVEERIENTRKALENAAVQTAVQYPAGVLVDGEWYRQGFATAAPVTELSYTQQISRVFNYWAQGRIVSERSLKQFVADLPGTCARLISGIVQFTPLQLFLTQRASVRTVKNALAEFPAAADPQWMPRNETPGLRYHEWLRRGSSNLKGLMLPPTAPWQRREMASPDQDEMCLIRVAHGLRAEMIETLRVAYRRAYERIQAEGLPMHLDRRWAAMPDLIRSSRQNEVSTIWEMAREHASNSGPTFRVSLQHLWQSLATALEVDPKGVMEVPLRANDFILTIFPINSQLRMPPEKCPILFSFSRRPAHELRATMVEAVNNLKLAEKFMFIVNVNNWPELNAVAEGMKLDGYNAVVLQEADFKTIASSPEPMRVLMEIVVSQIDLNLISPFYTSAPVPEHMFFGRDVEIQEVRTKILTHSVSLIGGRRIGKTSTLQKIQRELKKDAGMTAYYLDCYNVMNYESFFRSITTQWGVKVENNDPTCFDTVVMQLRRRHGEGQQLIFLLDEVDGLLRADRMHHYPELLFRTLRALSNQRLCQFIFSGERLLLSTASDSQSALFNFTQRVRLRRLERAHVQRLVVEPFRTMSISLEDEGKIITRIYQVTAGQPYIVQWICKTMIAELNRAEPKSSLLRYEHLQRALEQPELQEEIIQTFWGQVQPLAKLITLLWPPDETTFTLADMLNGVRARGATRVTISQMKEAARELDLYNVLNFDGRQCQLVAEDFPEVLDRAVDRPMLIEEILQEHFGVH